MIRALENNTLGVVLASVCGVFVALILGLFVLWALPPSGDLEGGEEAETAMPSDIPSLQSASALEAYNEIRERPVFNEDRRPAPVFVENEDEGPDIPIDDIGAPDVELAGIVITPTLRMATLRTKEDQFSLVAFEGKPLEGEFGSWQVSRIDERMVTLASDQGEEMQLELQVHDAVIKEPPKPEPAGDAAAETAPEGEDIASAEDAEASEAMSRAEQIRQRIEERREELRRAAEERESEQGENYRDAIQSMINQRNEQRAAERAEEEGRR